MEPYIEGLYLNERLVALYSDFGYGLMWQEESGNKKQMQMGVNMIVFAMTQQGGFVSQITNRQYSKSDSPKR